MADPTLAFDIPCSVLCSSMKKPRCGGTPAFKMKVGSKEWQHFIIEGARSLGIEINEAATAAFSIHASELINWNRIINLTAITDPRDIAAKHILDSLAPAEFIPDEARLLDIGSGGGFPGIPLKIFKPAVSVLLIDGVRKKVNFLKHLIRTLRLVNIEALQVRAENLRQVRRCEHSFDVIISRALSDLAPFVNSALPLLADQGKIIAMKGEVDPKELTALRTDTPADRYALDVKNYRLPSIDATRSLVIVKHLN
jgi:16S rRNA (guanine527-N7)-methyltransferase